MNLNTVFMICAVALLAYWIYSATMVWENIGVFFKGLLGITDVSSYLQQAQLTGSIVSLRGNIIYYGFFVFNLILGSLLLLKVIIDNNKEKIEDLTFTFFLLFCGFYGVMATFFISSSIFPQRLLTFGWIFGVIPLAGFILTLERMDRESLKVVRGSFGRFMDLGSLREVKGSFGGLMDSEGLMVVKGSFGRFMNSEVLKTLRRPLKRLTKTKSLKVLFERFRNWEGLKVFKLPFKILTKPKNLRVFTVSFGGLRKPESLRIFKDSFGRLMDLEIWNIFRIPFKRLKLIGNHKVLNVMFVVLIFSFMIFNLYNIDPNYTGKDYSAAGVADYKEYAIADTIKFDSSYTNSNTSNVYYGYNGVTSAIFDEQGIDPHKWKDVSKIKSYNKNFSRTNKVAIINENIILQYLSYQKVKSIQTYNDNMIILSYKNSSKINKIGDLGGNIYVLVGTGK